METVTATRNGVPPKPLRASDRPGDIPDEPDRAGPPQPHPDEPAQPDEMPPARDEPAREARHRSHHRSHR